MHKRSLLMLAGVVAISAIGGCKTETTTTTVPPGKSVKVANSDETKMRPTDTGGPRKQPQLVSVQPLPGATSALVGKPVRISFRRDALGLASNSIPEPTASMITGRPVQLSGIVQSVADGWIVIRADSQPNEPRNYWVPTASILLIESEASP